MKKYLFYDKATGKINFSYSGPMPEIQGAHFIESYVDPSTVYIVDGDIIDRSNMDLTTESFGFSNVPVGTEVKILFTASSNGFLNSLYETYIVDDGILDFSGGSSGIYDIELYNFPYLDTKVKYEN